MEKNTAEPDKPHMAIWRTRIARWIPKATNTHPGYVILIAFPLQQRFTRTSVRVTSLYVCIFLSS